MMSLARLVFLTTWLLLVDVSMCLTRDILPRKANSSPKLVFAHYMVANTRSYSQADWIQDIQLASSKGFDAFVLNIGRESWYYDLVANAYSASQASGTDLKLFLSLDMTSIPCSSQHDMNLVRSLVFSFASHPSQQFYQGKPLVSTFSGERCTFGMGNVNHGWTVALKHYTREIFFMPTFFVPPWTLSHYPVADSAVNWNAAWPMDNNPITFNPDYEYLNNLGGRPYVPAVSPWFFTHYGPHSFNKNFIYRSADWLLSQRWESIIEHRDRIDLVEFLTWNDFGESNYVSSKGEKPGGAEQWVDGYDHLGWLELTSYYIQAFKQGTYPRIDKDRLFLWTRLHPKEAHSPDPVPRPTNWEYSQDVLWAVTATREPAHIILACGRSGQVFYVPAGLNKISLPLRANGGDCQVKAGVFRDNKMVLYAEPTGMVFRTQPSGGRYNFNAFVHATP